MPLHGLPSSAALTCYQWFVNRSDRWWGRARGWFWRQWWHCASESTGAKDFGLWGTIESLIGQRFETGNIRYIISTFPLREWLGVGLDHNAKILIILMGNGMCGYVLARCFAILDSLSGSSSIAIVNPLVIQDINKLGLRQTLLWWVFLFQRC